MLLKEISKQSDRVNLDVVDMERSKDAARDLAVDRVPTIVILSNNGSRLYFSGMPGGYQLKCLVDDIVDASEGTSELSETATRMIESLKKPTDVKVFVTPSCPYSPTAVRTAHRFAIKNPSLHAQMIESLEFSELTQKYGVLGVPTTIINDDSRFEGVLNDDDFARKIVDASG